MTRRALCAIALAACALLASGCARLAPAGGQPALHIAADETSAPLAGSLLNGYESLHAGALLTLSPMSREEALAAVRSGAADAALLLHPPDGTSLFHTPVARDSLVIVAHPDIPYESLSRRDVRAIFAGQVTTWPATNEQPRQPIQVAATEGTSSVRVAFDALVLQGQPVTGSARLAPTAADMVALTMATPGTISVAALSTLDGQSRILAYEGHTAPPHGTTRGTYPLITPVVLVTQEEPEDALRSLLDWILSAEGQEIVRRHMLAVND